MAVGKVIIVSTCLLIALSSVAECISVVGPKVLRPYSSYRVAVSGGSRAQTLYVAVEGRRANGDQFIQGRDVQVNPGASRLIELDISDPGPGQYALIARSTAGPQFSSSAPLVYQARSFCVFVQTDKRVYQPSDIINFRVVALDKYLLPLDGVVDVNILDAGGSAVRQWAALPLDRGIISAEFALADEPALGEWTIQVEARGQMYSRQILVADYVKPKFQMNIDMPKQLLFTDGRFTVNVTAKHFNGQPVNGELTLSSYAVFFSGVLQPVFSSPARKVVDFEGQVEVTYDLKTDLDLAEDAARPLVIEAVLEEKDTLIRQNVSSRILLLRTPYRLRVTAPDYYKPSLPYNVQIEVVDPNGELMKEAGDVTVERLWDDGAPVNVTTVQLKNGLATYTLIPDAAYVNSTLNLVIKYKEVTERVINVQSSAAAGGQYLTVEVLTRDTAVGGEMRARITATEPMDLLHYAVIGRGDIVITKTLELSPARKSVDVTVPVSSAMAPGSVLLAWYPRLESLEGAVLAAAVYVPHAQLIQHKVQVLVVGGGSRGGGAVELRALGAAGAHAALLAEDSRAAAAGLAGPDGLGSGLNMHTVEREVESFSGLRHAFFKNEDNHPSLGLDLGGNTAGDVFENAGVVILADGLITRSNTPEGSGRQHLPETGTRPPLAGPYAFSRLPPPPSPRYYLPAATAPQPTWLLANFSIGPDGKGSANRRTPITSADWTVGGFAVHPTLGLGLATPQTFSTGTPLAISAELPPYLQKGETVAIIITLTSNLAVDTTVELTFHNSEQYFEFEPLENNLENNKKIELFSRQKLLVPAHGSASTAFLVTVVKSGTVSVIVEATGNGVSASLFNTIEVEDGYEEELCTWSLVDGRRGVSRSNVSVAAAARARLSAGSARAAGDALAPALAASRLGRPSPAGDPAAALRPLAVAALLLDYLEATARDEVAITTEARAQASMGYQRLMAYRKPDGSFAADLDPDSEGDIWMTAVSARWLARSARHVWVSPGAAAAAARWLLRAQTPGGAWSAAAAPHPPHDPRLTPDNCLTAYVALALIDVPSTEYVHRNAITKALEVVAGGVEGSSAYCLALSAAALAAGRHARAAAALQALDAHTNTTDGYLFWSRSTSGSEWRNPWLRGNSAAAATAAFGLQAMLAQQLVDNAVPVGRYLLYAFRANDIDPDQLDALAQLAKSIKTPTKMRLAVNVTGSEEPRQFNIDDDNALIVQTQLVKTSQTATVTSSGRGVSVAALCARSSSSTTAPWPRYTLDPRVDAVSTSSRLQLSVCIGFVPQGNETVSGYALLTVQLPSGYIADIHTLTELTSARHITRARLEAGGSRVLAWLRGLGPRERCATLAAPRAAPVARARPGYATVLDLYDSSHRARVFFSAVPATPCELCRTWASCARACGAAAGRRAEDTSDNDVTARTGRSTATTTGVTILGVVFGLVAALLG